MIKAFQNESCRLPTRKSCSSPAKCFTKLTTTSAERAEECPDLNPQHQQSRYCYRSFWIYIYPIASVSFGSHPRLLLSVCVKLHVDTTLCFPSITFTREWSYSHQWHWLFAESGFHLSFECLGQFPLFSSASRISNNKKILLAQRKCQPEYFRASNFQRGKGTWPLKGQNHCKDWRTPTAFLNSLWWHLCL